MTTAKTAPQPEAVRVTVEADAEGDSENSIAGVEEIEDISSAATCSSSSGSSSEESAKAQPQAPPSKKRRKPEASGAAGLANVIRGLLAKSQPAGSTSGCPILTKALTDRQRFAPAAGSAAGADAKGDDDDDDKDLSTARHRRLVAERRRWLAAGRTKPSGGPGSREAERELQRVACRGVVQLFNAVRAQQRALDARLVGKSEAGRQRVLSSLSRADFLDMLAGRRNRNKAAAGKAEEAENGEQDEEEDSSQKKKKKKKSWSVLSEDYLVKPTLTMKDWDKASSDGSAAGEEGGAPEAMEEDD